MKRNKVIAAVMLAVVAIGLYPACGFAAPAYQRYYFVKPDGTKVFIFSAPGRSGLDQLLERVLRGLPVPDLVPRDTAPAPAPVPREEEELPGTGDRTALLTAEESEMVRLVNAERVRRGLRPLEVDERLVELARKKSRDMVEKNYFGHISPRYGSPFDMMKSSGISYRIAGENLAGAPTVLAAHNALMNSEGHRRNILNPAYTKIGVGVVKGGPYGMMFTQMFIGE